jgi:hypothetical protein
MMSVWLCLFSNKQTGVETKLLVCVVFGLPEYAKTAENILQIL